MIDARPNYKTRIDKVYEKAAKVTAALTRLMANIGWPRQSRRALLAKVSQSVPVYAGTSTEA